MSKKFQVISLIIVGVVALVVWVLVNSANSSQLTEEQQQTQQQ